MELRSKIELMPAIRRDSRVVLVVNMSSRRARAARSRLPRELEAAGIEPIAREFVTDPSELSRALGDALALRPDLLIFGGGDGSMATAAGYLAHRDVALGVLPLGTTNNFARSLQLPLDLAGAVRVIAEGRVVSVDLGLVTTDAGERELFANLASVGLSVEVARHTPHALKRRLGRAAYALTALRALPGHRPFSVTVTTSGRRHTFWTHQLNIANGRFHAGSAIARDARIDDHQLVIYRLGDGRRHRLTSAMVLQLLRGARRDLATTPYLTTRQALVVADPPLAVDIDGEIHGCTPITLSTAPDALRVMVPDAYAEPARARLGGRRR